MSLSPVETDDSRWQRIASQWNLRQGVTYLNHGSFGPWPRVVREAHRRWSDELESEPIDFFNRRMPALLADARQSVGEFLGTSAANLAFVENATAAMNVVAASVTLKP